MDDDVTMERNEQLQRMIRDLGRMLAEAISDSTDASQTLRRLHNEGYAVSLALGRSPEGGPEEMLTVMLEKRGREPRLESAGADDLGESLGEDLGEDLRPPTGAPREPGSREPQFRMHGSDLAFLRSVGIDPTRSAKRRRR
jgi:hypothetical protein